MQRPDCLGVSHVALLTLDVPRAERFYHHVLGLAVRARHHDDRGLRSVWMDLGDGRFVALERASLSTSSKPHTATGLHALILGMRARDRTGWTAWLGRCGVRILRESPFSVYFRDPDGNLVGLSHHPAAAPDGVVAQSS